MNNYVVFDTDGWVLSRFVQATESGLPGQWARVENVPSAASRPSPRHRLRYDGHSVVWALDLSLQEARAQRWAEIKVQREVLDSAPVSVGDFTVDGGQQARLDIMGAIMKMQILGEAQVVWRCADNVMRSLSLSQLVAVGVAIAERRTSLIATSDTLWQTIQAAQTVEEVVAVTWPD